MPKRNSKSIIKLYKSIYNDISKGLIKESFARIKSIKKIIDDSHEYITDINTYEKKYNGQNYHIQILGMFGGCLIDIGYNDLMDDALDWGVNIYQSIYKIKNIDKNDNYANILFNYANGLSEQLKRKQGLLKQIFFKDNESIELSEKTKIIYRETLQYGKNNPRENVNYGNLLEQQFGRSYESIEYYDRALSKNPNHSMALANKGETLYYLSYFNSNNAAKVLIFESYFLIKKALEIRMEVPPQQYFEKKLQQILKTHPWLRNEKYLSCNAKINQKKSFKSFYYRFCHKNQLFLNPLSKDHKCDAALCDSLLLRGVLAKNGNNKYHRFAEYINRLKQEYVFARYLTAQSFYQSSSISFIDRDVDLIDTLNYTMYNIFIEQARVAYRVAFSILDKTAFIVNDYYELGFSDKSISFEKISIRKHFIDMPNTKITNKLKKLTPINNPFLAAIIDLANDFTGDYFENIREVRRTLEHRFYNIYMMSDDGKLTPEYFRDTLLELLKLIKSAIFYTVLMIDWQERKKLGQVDKSKIVELDTYLINDSFKKEYL